MTEKAEQQSKPTTDVTDLLTDDDLAAIRQFRDHLKQTHYGGHDYCSVTVGMYTGRFRPDEGEHELLKLTFLSRQDQFIETVCRRVMGLARVIDPGVEPSDDRSLSLSVDSSLSGEAASA